MGLSLVGRGWWLLVMIGMFCTVLPEMASAVQLPGPSSLLEAPPEQQ